MIRREGSSLSMLPSSDFQVASSEALRLPTLKEIIGYQTNDYTSTPSSVHLSLLPVNTDNYISLQNVEEQGSLYAQKEYNFVLDRLASREGLYAEKAKLDELSANDFPVSNDVENDVDASVGKKRKTRIDHAGLTTSTEEEATIKPTTMRGIPLTTLPPNSDSRVTRGFYVTKSDGIFTRINATVTKIAMTTVEPETDSTSSTLENNEAFTVKINSERNVGLNVENETTEAVSVKDDKVEEATANRTTTLVETSSVIVRSNDDDQERPSKEEGSSEKSELRDSKGFSTERSNQTDESITPSIGTSSTTARVTNDARKSDTTTSEAYFVNPEPTTERTRNRGRTRSRNRSRSRVRTTASAPVDEELIQQNDTIFVEPKIQRHSRRRTTTSTFAPSTTESTTLSSTTLTRPSSTASSIISETSAEPTEPIVSEGLSDPMTSKTTGTPDPITDPITRSSTATLAVSETASYTEPLSSVHELSSNSPTTKSLVSSVASTTSEVDTSAATAATASLEVKTSAATAATVPSKAETSTATAGTTPSTVAASSSSLASTTTSTVSIPPESETTDSNEIPSLIPNTTPAILLNTATDSVPTTTTSSVEETTTDVPSTKLNMEKEYLEDIKPDTTTVKEELETEREETQTTIVHTTTSSLKHTIVTQKDKEDVQMTTINQTTEEITDQEYKSTSAIATATTAPLTRATSYSTEATVTKSNDVKEKKIGRRRGGVRFDSSNYNFGQKVSRRNNVYNRVTNDQFNTDTDETYLQRHPGRRQYPRRRVTVYRRRQQKVDATSVTENSTVVENEPTVNEKTVDAGLKGEERPQDPPLVENNTERPVAEVNVTKNTGLPPRKPGTLLTNRLRKPNPSTLSTSSPQNRLPSTHTTYRKNRPTGTTQSPVNDKDTTEETTEIPKQSEKEGDQRTEVVDQSSRAQELAVTLADPPSQAGGSGRQPLRDTLRRKISTTVAPRTDSTTSRTTLRLTTVFRNRQKPRTKDRPIENVTTRPRRPPIIDYDYYEDEEEPIVGKSTSNGKLYLTNTGTIRCLEQGNFPHPYSCKKFITCARMVNGQVIGAEYTCPDKLSFDPVGGICNWSAGLGCKE